MARVVAVACLRGTPGGTQVLFVHDRAGRWVLPKGRVEHGEDDAAAGLRELAEEAGVVGSLTGARGRWTHRTRRGRRQQVTVLAGQVEAGGVPQQPWRRPTWVPLAVLGDLAAGSGHYRRLARALDGLAADVTAAGSPAMSVPGLAVAV